MTDRHILVIGGGLAGLSAAVACQDAGARVTLLEARPRLGGATWSTRRHGLWIDNGQHIFMRCFSAYRAFLERLGVSDRVDLQERLAVPVLVPGRRASWIRSADLPAPGHLAPSLLRFAPLRPRDRLRAGLTALRLGRLDPGDPDVERTSFGSWLQSQGESDEAIDRFWDLLIRPTVNLSARQASLSLAAVVFQTGLLRDRHSADIGVSKVPLQALHAEPAQARLLRGGAEVRLRARVTRLEPAAASRGPSVWLDGERLAADAVVLATPHETAAALLPPEAKLDPAALRRLGSSPILNLHVVFDRPVTDHAFFAGLGTPLQWVFDRSAGAGLERGQYLAVSLSAADAYHGQSVADLRARFLPAFAALLPAARQARVEHFLVTREPTATFRQAPGTRALRPGPEPVCPGLHLAGAWTDTGWPATMEGAVRSGLAAARSALSRFDAHPPHRSALLRSAFN